MEKDRRLPLYEPPMARDLSGGGISGQDSAGWCSNGGSVAYFASTVGCNHGSAVSGCSTGLDAKSQH
jgi:hypothetical protein